MWIPKKPGETESKWVEDVKTPTNANTSKTTTSPTDSHTYHTRTDTPSSKFQSGITGFVRIPNSQDPNKVYAIGTGGRPITNEADLMKATGASSVAEAWQLANVRTVTPDEATSLGINLAAKVSINDLKTENGEVSNRLTGEKYEDEAALAKALQVPVEQIDWKEISDAVIPDKVAANETFQNLTPEDKSYFAEYYKILKENDAEKQKTMKDALDQAKAQADPYFAEKIRIVQDELSRATTAQSGDFASKKKTLEDSIAQIQEDLTTNVGRLTLDQQVELRKQEDSYKEELDGLRENAAQSGLTFSTRRAVAEDKLNTENTNYVESTKRTYQRKIDDLKTAAARGDQSAKDQLADYERQYGENVTTLVRAAEGQLGSDAITGTLKSSALGDVTGSMAEDKNSDILTRANALASLQNPLLT